MAAVELSSALQETLSEVDLEGKPVSLCRIEFR